MEAEEHDFVRLAHLCSRPLPDSDGTLLKRLPDSQFEEITSLIDSTLHKEEWSSRPRTYAVLNMIGRVHAMEAFVRQGLTDLSFPYTDRRQLPSMLDYDAQEDFLYCQTLVYSEILDIEKGRHVIVLDGDKAFKSIAELGRGSEGVDKVKSRQIPGKVYARKRLSRKAYFKGDKNIMKAYQIELEALKGLSHPHLVTVEGSYTDKKWLALLLHPVAELNLKQYLSHDGGIPAHEVEHFKTYFGCLAHTLWYLRDQKIQHKDIKPENVLLKYGKDGYQLFLTDFGTAWNWAASGQSVSLPSNNDRKTPSYQSPEVARGTECHFSSDIWSLGVVYLEMATVLREKGFREMAMFFTNHGTGNSAVWNNLEGALQWLELIEPKSKRHCPDTGPRKWIRAMLVDTPAMRISVQALCEEIDEFKEDKYCGRCCSNEESSDDSDASTDTNDAAEEAARSLRDEFSPVKPVNRVHPSQIAKSLKVGFRPFAISFGDRKVQTAVTHSPIYAQYPVVDPISKHDAVDSISRRGAVNSISKQDTADTIPRRDAVDLISKQDAVDSGSKPDAVDSGSKPDAVDSGSKPDAVDSGSKPDAVDLISKQDAVDSGLKQDAVDSGSKPDAVDLISKPDAVDSGLKPDAVDSGSKSDAVDLIPKQDAVDSGLKQDAVDSGSKPDAVDSGSKRDAVDSGSKRDAVDLISKQGAVDLISKQGAVDLISKQGAVDLISKQGAVDLGSKQDTVVQENMLNQKNTGALLEPQDDKNINSRDSLEPRLADTSRMDHFFDSLEFAAGPQHNNPQDKMNVEGFAASLAQTRPAAYPDGVRRVASLSDMGASTQVRQQGYDDMVDSEAATSRIARYPSDSALHVGFKISQDTLRQGFEDLKTLAEKSRCAKPLPDPFTALESSINEVMPAAEERSPRKRAESTEKVQPPVPQTLTSFLGSISATAQTLQQSLSQARGPSAPSKTALTAANLRALPDSSGAIRPSKAKSYRERLLSNVAKTAPTTVLSAATRHRLSTFKPLLHYNDRFYGFLEKYTKSGKVAAVRYLLDAGCNPGSKEKPRLAPLFNTIRSASERHTKCLLTLIEHRVDVNPTRPWNKPSPLLVAVGNQSWTQYATVIYILLQAGADPDACDERKTPSLLLLLQGLSPLSTERRDALHFLLAPNYNTDIGVQCPITGDTALHLAVRRTDVEIVDAIFDKIDEIKSMRHKHALLKKKNKAGLTPLRLAYDVFHSASADSRSRNVHEEIVKMLLSYDADPDSSDPHENNTPLHVALSSEASSLGLITLLLEKHANLYLRNRRGETPSSIIIERMGEAVEADLYHQVAQEVARFHANDIKAPDSGDSGQKLPPGELCMCDICTVSSRQTG